MNLTSIEMLNTLETLADKLSNPQNKILLDNNGNKVNCAISRTDKVQQHPYHKDNSIYNRSPNNTNNNSNKYIEK